MGWIIVALGAVFAAFGGYFAYSGLDIVQAERGWTAVIAGTSLLSAGVVSLALGLMTLKITALAKNLQFNRIAPDAPKPWAKTAEVAVEKPVESSSLAPAAIAGAGVAVVAAAIETGQADLFAHDAHAKPEPEIKVEHLAAPHEEAAISTSHHIEPAAVEHEAASLAPSPEIPAAEDIHKTILSNIQRPTPKSDWPLEVAVSHPAEPEAPEDVHVAEPEPEEPEVEPLPPPPDWLTNAAKPAAPPQDLLPELKHTPNPHIETPHIETREAAAHGHHEDGHQHEAAHPASENTETHEHHIAESDVSHPAPAAHHPVVVGRYEAAGTNYAMYSDGSVEAENEHGIFRFASMAELRAFIEEGKELTSEIGAAT